MTLDQARREVMALANDRYVSAIDSLQSAGSVAHRYKIWWLAEARLPTTDEVAERAVSLAIEEFKRGVRVRRA